MGIDRLSRIGMTTLFSFLFLFCFVMLIWGGWLLFNILRDLTWLMEMCSDNPFV